MLPAPWDQIPDVIPLHRLRVGEGVGVPEGTLLAERAVLRAGFTGMEALGAPGDAVPPTRLVMLTHGGPRTAEVQSERPVAGGEVVDPISGRTPRKLSAGEWDALHQAFLDEAAAALHTGAYGVGVEAARGQLWHSAISPLLSSDVDAGLWRLTRLVRALRGQTERVMVSLVVEEVFAGGIHAGLGVKMARALVDAGASMILVRTGGPHMPARLVPPEPRMPEEEGPALHAAKWVKAALPSTTVLCAGALRSDAVIRMAREKRFCDGVVVERVLK